MKTRERYVRVKQLFLATCKQEPEQRARFLDEACAGDGELRRRVDALLSHHDEDAASAPALDLRAAPLPEADRFQAGDVFADRYRIVTRLGRGGMGEVYRADDLTLGVPVALKFLQAGGRLHREALLNEVRLARQVSHPAVCRVFDVGEVEGQTFFTMEYIEGEDLASELRRIGRLPAVKVLEVARELCAGLAAAHARGVLHRDLKPANVMLDAGGRARIVDFGIAIREGGTDQVPVGTPAYMAPEQLVPGGTTTEQTDLYALGLVLYEALAGRPVFRAQTLAERLALQRGAALPPPSPPSEWEAQIDPRLERVVLEALQEDPRKRPASARLMARALEESARVAGPSAAPVRDASRRLAALLSADVAGYSRLMADDEQATIRTLSAYRKALGDLVEEHRGRVVDAPGDNLLAEFPTALDAVLAAVEIQKVLKVRNESLPEARRMQFRIGVHLGDVSVQGGRLYGDGVNIAARLEGLAPAGAICVSAAVHEQVGSKLELGFEDLGEQTLKNIPQPVRVYQVRLTAAEPSAAQPPLYPPLPDKPSIAVLPFENLSDDPEQAYFADGVTEDLTSDLAGVPDVFVIARNSAFSYRDKKVRVAQVGRELGVRYVIQGSVRWAPERVRVTAQLIDASTGRQLWSDRYDFERSDLFAIQSELAEQILTALPVQVRKAELRRIQRRPTENLTAYEAFARGYDYYNRQTEDGFRRALELYERATQLDPNYADAYWGVGVAIDRLGQGLPWKEREESLDRAEQAARRALELDAFNPRALTLLGWIAAEQGRLEEGLDRLARAAELAPSLAEPHTVRAALQARAGNLPAALESATRAWRLDPQIIGPSLLGTIHYQAGHIDTGLMWLAQARAGNPDEIPSRVLLASHCEAAGRHAEARVLLEELRRIRPGITVDVAAARGGFDAATAAQIAENLRSAGLPDRADPDAEAGSTHSR